jgi:hypothetical protein
MPLERFERLDAVARFGDDVQVGLLVDDVRDARSKQRVIVHEQHARSLSCGGCRLSLQRAPASAMKTAPMRGRLRFRCAAR